MGFLVKAVGAVVKAVGSVLTGILSLVTPKSNKVTQYKPTLNKTLDPEAFRKIVFGNTAGVLDLRDWQVWGSNNQKYDEAIFVATHRINAFLELYLEDELAIDAAGTVQTKYVGTLTRNVKTGINGQTALVVGDGTQWNAYSTCDGCAVMVLHWLPTQDKLPNGVPSRYTQRVEGALVYDPRRDSTNGGSGAHRMADNTTWEYAPTDSNGVPIGRNNALQALWYLLGWYVPNTVTGELILVAGRGVDPTDINVPSFITGANNCEAARYYTDMQLSTQDAHTANEDKITAGGLIGQLMDVGGLWSYYANVDDTASVALVITDDDVIQGGTLTWNEFKGISEQYQQVSGKFIDPSPNALYVENGYPMVRDTTYEAATGLKRRKTQDFAQVQDVLLSQKLARLLLNQGQYQGELTGSFLYRALKAQAWSIVQYNSDRFAWSKLYRVWRHEITPTGGIQMLLREVNASIWTAGSVVTPPAPSAGVKYDPSQQIPVVGFAAYANPLTGSDGTIVDGTILSWTAAPANARRTEVQLKQTSATYWESRAPLKIDQSTLGISPLLSGTSYDFRVRHISIHEVAGAWSTTTFVVGSTSNVRYPALANLASDELNRNSSFEIFTGGLFPGWQIDPGYAGGGSFSQSSYSFGAGRGYYSVLVTGSTVVKSELIAVQPGEAIWVEAHLCMNSGRNGANPGTQADLYVAAYFSNSNSYTSGANTNLLVQSRYGGSAATDDVWKVIVPAGYTTMFLQFSLDYGISSLASCYVGNLSASRRQPGSTRNVTTYSAVDPGGIDGDLWVDTSGTYVVFKLRSGGAWVTGANALSAYNALTGKPIALSDINTTESTKLAGIAAGADVTASQPIVSNLSSASGQALSTFVLSNGVTPLSIVASGSNRDGDTISFGPFAKVPKILFLPGGNAATGGQNIAIQPLSLSVSGFTLKAKSQGVTPGSTVTDGSATSGTGGEPTKVINRTSSSHPYDNVFKFNYSVTVGNIAPGEPGSVQVDIYVKISGSWVNVGSNYHGASGTYSLNATLSSVDFGAGNEFGVSISYATGAGTALSAFNNVKYTPGTVTETSLTPSGASDIPWIATL